jgi:hypothetical protein
MTTFALVSLKYTVLYAPRQSRVNDQWNDDRSSFIGRDLKVIIVIVGI